MLETIKQLFRKQDKYLNWYEYKQKINFRSELEFQQKCRSSGLQL